MYSQQEFYYDLHFTCVVFATSLACLDEVGVCVCFSFSFQVCFCFSLCFVWLCFNFLCVCLLILLYTFPIFDTFCVVNSSIKFLVSAFSKIKLFDYIYFFFKTRYSVEELTNPRSLCPILRQSKTLYEFSPSKLT